MWEFIKAHGLQAAVLVISTVSLLTGAYMKLVSVEQGIHASIHSNSAEISKLSAAIDRMSEAIQTQTVAEAGQATIVNEFNKMWYDTDVLQEKESAARDDRNHTKMESLERQILHLQQVVLFGADLKELGHAGKDSKLAARMGTP